MNKSYSLIDEVQIGRVVKILTEKKRIYVYGKGSSGMVGMEMKLRFMRIGVNIEAITDEHIMKMNSVLLDEECGVIGITVSGMLFAVKENLERGKAISPQFPILIMVDMIYSRMLRSDGFRRRETLHEYTMEALDER